MSERNEGADLLLEKRWELKQRVRRMQQALKDAEDAIRKGLADIEKICGQEAELVQFLKKAGITDQEITDFDEVVESQLVAAELRDDARMVEKSKPERDAGPEFPSGRRIPYSRHGGMDIAQVSSF